MKKNEQEKFRALITKQLESVRNFIKLGEDRSKDAKLGNFKEICEHLKALGFSTNDDNVREAAKIVSECFANRPVEIEFPAKDNTAKALAEIQRIENDSTSVRLVRNNVDVRMDRDQNKHQAPGVPIGTRTVRSGNMFKNTCNEQWHKTVTLQHMATWAEKLAKADIGTKTYHGQSMPVDSIHYEGFCYFGPNDKRYVLFHCYPSDNSRLKL